jgi:hypothetical protein
MPLTSIGAVWDRISTVTAMQGYHRASKAFDFEQQPDITLERAFHIQSERTSTVGYLGGDQAEQHRISLYMALRTKRNEVGAARQLKVDVDLLEDLISSGEEAASYDYIIEDDSVESEIRDTQLNQDYVVGRLAFTVDFDRQMT